MESHTIPLPFMPSLDGKVTLDEGAAILIAGLVAVSLLFLLLQRILLYILQNPRIKELLMKVEIHAEIVAMNQSVRYAFKQAREAPEEADKSGYRRVGSPNGQMGSSTSALILAESKAVTSKADDARKVTKPSKTEVIAGPKKSKYGRGRAGVMVDKKGRATLVYPGDGVCARARHSTAT